MALPSSTLAVPRAGFLFPTSPATAGNELELACDPYGALYVTEGLPRYASQANAGNLVTAITTTLRTGIAALPTTTADAQLYNGEAAGGKSYVLMYIGFAIQAVDTTQADVHTLVYNIQTPANVTASGIPTDATNTKVKMNGNAYGGKARISLGATIVNNGWMFAPGQQPPTAGVVAGSVWHSYNAVLDGMIVLQPGGAIGLTQLSVSTTATAVSYQFTWMELVLPPAA